MPDTFEGMVQWAMANPSDSRFEYAGRPAISAQFGIGSHIAGKVTAEVRRRMQAAEKQGAADNGDGDMVYETTMRYEETGNGARVTFVSRHIRTVEDALAKAEVDEKLWQVDHFLVNHWEMGSKDAEGNPQATPLWQVKVWLKRRSPLEIGLEALISRVEPAQSYPVPDRNGDRMVEIAIYDPHFGMLSWAAETGEDYDVRIARRVVGDAAAQICEQTADLDLDYYLLPFGNDWLHVNDPTRLTPQNRNVLDVDTRLAKIIEEATRGLHDMIEMLAKEAPVKLLWIPGNHDPQTSYWMLREAAARFRDDGRVEVDTSPKPRKYHLYGVNLIGFLHGCNLATSKDKALAGLMADEAADLWAPGQYREIHRGHTHKKGELWFVGADTYGSVVVRTIPSLVGTDYWSFQKGFVETSKTAQYFIWNKTHGLEAVRDVHVDRSLYADTTGYGE